MARLTALRSFFARALRAPGEAGASLVEYTPLVALIAAVAIGAITVLGNGAKDTLCNAGNTIANAGATTTTVAGGGSSSTSC
jgi:Flp pilus assembly pilin Flp